METLNDYYPIYSENPENANLSDSERSENNNYVETLRTLNENRKRKRTLTFDDFCLVHSDDLWYLWCMVNEFTVTNTVAIFDKIDYAKFCVLCYENSTRM